MIAEELAQSKASVVALTQQLDTARQEKQALQVRSLPPPPPLGVMGLMLDPANVCTFFWVWVRLRARVVRSVCSAVVWMLMDIKC